MKKLTSKKGITLFLYFALLLLGGCTIEKSEIPKVLDLSSLNCIKPDNNGNITIEDSPIPPAAELKTRLVDGGDVDDVVLEPASSAPDDDCDKVCFTFPGVENCDALCELLWRSRPQEMKTGARIGVMETESQCPTYPYASAFKAYILNKDSLTGYMAKERSFPFTIEKDGNYRVQMTPLSANKNLDLFIFKKRGTGTGQGTTDIKNLAAWSTQPEGMTETIYLTDKGRYHIILDEKGGNNNCTEGNFILSISANTDLVFNPLLYRGKLSYYITTFKKPSADKPIAAWGIRQRKDGNVGPLIYYVAMPYILYHFPCKTCDYIIAPVYINPVTRELTMGEGATFRP